MSFPSEFFNHKVRQAQLLELARDQLNDPYSRSQTNIVIEAETRCENLPGKCSGTHSYLHTLNRRLLYVNAF